MFLLGVIKKFFFWMDLKKKRVKLTESPSEWEMLSKCSVFVRGLPCSIIREHAWKAITLFENQEAACGRRAFNSRSWSLIESFLPQSPAKAMQTIWRMPILSGDAWYNCKQTNKHSSLSVSARDWFQKPPRLPRPRCSRPPHFKRHGKGSPLHLWIWELTVYEDLVFYWMILAVKHP